MNNLRKSTFTIQRNFVQPDNISMNLQCPICSDVFNNPIRLDCGHTYCLDCLDLWMKKTLECPNCRAKINISLISRDLLAYNIINDLEVSCNNESKGCPWKGRLEELRNHMKTCDDNINFLIEKKNPNEQRILTPIINGNNILKRKHNFFNTEIKQQERPLLDLLVKYNLMKKRDVPTLSLEDKEWIKKRFCCSQKEDEKEKDINNKSTCK